jgi:hypothetical protein
MAAPAHPAGDAEVAVSKHLIDKPTSVVLYLPEGIVTRSIQHADGVLHVWAGKPSQIGLKINADHEYQDTGKPWTGHLWIDEYLTEETEETDS